ncbi:MAG: transposase [Prevotella sp.]|uniref:Transposase n=1 Tax=Segatella cerevisiae TaxID=2053716 RepID=A0ABT1BYJ1_9BACT|nr:transposase [Segatella cerevisiae]MCH3969430.1 transposase [Prevotella sp.]MCH3993436.1 transposase [Prevotella sp.]MCH4018986.1 transposase [Prevotella sp.]MCO6026157.1 transposase [Segatella cerevisiae]
MDTSPVTARSLEPYYKINGDRLERSYKDYLSDFRQWEQKPHASDWILLEKNMGPRLSIDETSLQEDLFTILSNKDGHGRRGTVIAAVRGTKASEVIRILMQIPQEKRIEVREVTMDFSDSMYSIVSAVFPNATIVIDCFHIIKRCGDAVEEIRLRSKREAIKDQRKKQAEFRNKLEQRVKQRKYYRKKHPRRYKGRKRGRKPIRLNERFKPEILDNGDTGVELLTRSRGLLRVSRNNWSDTQKIRAGLLFSLYPKIKEAYNLVDSLRNVFRMKTLDRVNARNRLHEWYQKVAGCSLREVKSARDAVRFKEEEVLNYFINRSTNAAAESLNSKLKRFRAQLHGVSDLPFFMYRVSLIFG